MALKRCAVVLLVMLLVSGCGLSAAPVGEQYAKTGAGAEAGAGEGGAANATGGSSTAGNAADAVGVNSTKDNTGIGSSDAVKPGMDGPRVFTSGADALGAVMVGADATGDGGTVGGGIAGGGTAVGDEARSNGEAGASVGGAKAGVSGINDGVGSGDVKSGRGNASGSPPQASEAEGSAGAGSQQDAAADVAAGPAGGAVERNGEADAEATVEATGIVLSIVGDAEKGVILEATDVELHKNDTVLDVLKRGAKAHKIPMEYRGSGMFAYVEGIANLYEFDDGPESGWVFRVNGGLPSKGAGTVKVNKGDVVEWLYTTDLGKSEQTTE